MSSTSPTWAPLAATALTRLRADYAELAANRPGSGRRPWQPEEPAARKMSDRNTEPLGWRAAAPTATQIPSDAHDAVRAAGGDPLAVEGQSRDRPAVHVPTADLLLMLRLCATIGSEDRLEAILATRAVTLIEIGPDTGGLSPMAVRSMLETAILPDAALVWTAAPLKDADTTVDGMPDLCVVEITAEDPDKLRIKGAALQAVTRALDAPYPVLILAETLAQLPEDLRRALPGALQLAPLSRDILMAMIAATRSATGKIDPDLFEALPEERALARLSDASLTLALRAGTPPCIAARLAEITRQTSDGGPTLDEIEGYGEAEAAARRMVADLADWAKGAVAWSDVQRSVLFYGPPGTGKSHLARAMAGSAGAPLVRGSFADVASAGHSVPHAAGDAREFP